MIFLTVGTQFPFDRLVRAVDQAVASGQVGDEVFAQVGHGGYQPGHMRWAETLERGAFADYLVRSAGMIGHAGTGTILMALEAGKPLLVMPRLSRYGEIVNDHQVGTAQKFAAQGHVLVARDETEIPQKIRELQSFVPVPRQINPYPVIARVKAFLDQVERGRTG